MSNLIRHTPTDCHHSEAHSYFRAAAKRAKALDCEFGVACCMVSPEKGGGLNGSAQHLLEVYRRAS